MGTLDIFLNFPVAAMNRSVLWKVPEGVDEDQIARMNAFWGDESWKTVAYSTAENLFGEPEKQPNAAIVAAFQERLQRVAGFTRVPPPIPMRNSNGGVIYYLFFASQKDTAQNIVSDIFNRYRAHGVR